ncbi:uncharacterized protein LOC110854659 isoform X2 [Folsomia candida]|uniref:uncharacterized protein LOC110854659 isoform X2 n=1 Tax=Folsomia candida TaxID=158441 RepID=UPI0016051BEA|nr:uncharacterized protein LOC110854659 isoform X2 [Folsomia candida]
MWKEKSEEGLAICYSDEENSTEACTHCGPDLIPDVTRSFFNLKKSEIEIRNCTFYFAIYMYILTSQVIPHLCKFLATKDIKRCRLVCKSWNYNATHTLKGRTTIKIRLYPENDRDTDPFKMWDGIVQKMQFCQVNVHLEILNQLEYTLPPVGLKIFPPVGFLKSIFVQVYKAEQWQKDLCDKIVLNSALTLEKLRFEWRHDMDYFPFLRGTTFPELWELILWDIWDRRENDGLLLERIGQMITEAFPKLEYLKTNCNQLYEIGKMGFLSNFPGSLKSLELTGQLDAKGLKYIAKIPSSLKKLVFHQVSFDAYDPYLNRLPFMLHKLLEKHSPTLEKLAIDISWPDGCEKLKWGVPVFPALKSFRICHPTTFENIEFRDKLVTGNNWIRLDYNVCFPSLESLHVSTNELHVAFLPSAENRILIANSVKNVEIAVEDVRNKEEKLAFYKRLLDVFQNARDSASGNLKIIVTYKT